MATRSLKDGELGGVDGAGGGAAAVCAAGGADDAVAAGAPMLLLPEQPPVHSKAANSAAIGTPVLGFIGRKSRDIPNSPLAVQTTVARTLHCAMPRILYQANHGHPKAVFCP